MNLVFFLNKSLLQDEILSTSYLVAHYLQGIGFKKKVYLLGSNGIGDELKAVGIEHIGVGVSHQKYFIQCIVYIAYFKYCEVIIGFKLR